MMRAVPQPPRTWSEPDDIRRVLQKAWESEQLLSIPASEWPLRIKLVTPRPADWASRFADVRHWVDALEQGRRPTTAGGYHLVYEEVATRLVGRNRVPIAVTIASLDDALAMIGCRPAYERWTKLVTLAGALCPSVEPWARANPVQVLEQDAIWERLLRVLAWFLANPRSGRYLRQIDLPGIDTKFIERQVPLIRKLIGARPAPEEHTPDDGCDDLLGFRSKPPLIHLRVLDRGLAIHGLEQFSTPIADLVRLTISPTRVIITENEINGLTLPPLSGAVAIFGRGYALDVLGKLPWVARAEVHYWGDIDTHGFAMLDRLRAHVPRVSSFLMDEGILHAHQEAWGTEATPTSAVLTRLSPTEQSLYQNLLTDRWRHRLRLEQERVRYHHVEAWMQALPRLP